MSRNTLNFVTFVIPWHLPFVTIYIVQCYVKWERREREEGEREMEREKERLTGMRCGNTFCDWGILCDITLCDWDVMWRSRYVTDPVMWWFTLRDSSHYLTIMLFDAFIHLHGVITLWNSHVMRQVCCINSRYVATSSVQFFLLFTHLTLTL
jgi:hypothetical protein